MVALPVALAFGEASGLGPVAGIYSAIAVCFFASVFGGAPAQISGPSAPLTIAMAVILAQHADGDLTKAFTIVTLAGLLQIALGLLRIGSFVTYTPYSVISGFMSGIGVIVMAAQVLPFFGAGHVSGGLINSIQAWPEAVSGANWHALAVGLISLLASVFWPGKLSKYLPGLLVALILGLGQVVEPIPHAALAGILMKVGWDIVDWNFITRIREAPRHYLMVMLITLLLTVFVDLVTAVALGLIASAILSARQSEKFELDSVVSVPLLDQSFLSDPDADEDEFDMFQARAGLLAFRGHFSVASANELVRVVSADIHEHEVVIFDFSDTTYMDDSAALIMERLISGAGEEDTECIVMNLRGSAAASLNSFGVFKDVPDDRFVDDLDEARELVRSILNDKTS